MRVAVIGWLGFAFACAPAGAFAKEPTEPLPRPPAPELVSPLKEAGAASAAGALGEEQPPVGKGNLYSDAQIRYCLAQIIRIDAVRSLVNRYRKAQVEYFNGITVDYNSRCGSYRYEGDALETSKARVEANRWEIQSAAREAYAKRFAGEDKPVIASKPAVAPQTEPPPAAASLPPDLFPVPQPAQTPEAAPPSPPAKTPAVESRPPRPEHPVDGAPASPAAKPRPSPPPAVESRAEQPVESAPAVPAAKPRPSPPPAVESRAEQPVESAPAVPAAKPRPSSPPAVESRSTPAAQPAENVPAKPQPAAPPSAGSRPVRPEAPAQSTAAPAAKPGTTVPSPVESRAPREKPSAEAATAPPPSTPRSTAPAVAAARPSQSEPAPSPPPARKAAAETSPDAVWDQFARDVRRAGFQVVEGASYPEVARDRDWEGTTQVEVRYAAGGFIKSIVVGESSGYPPLDERALQIARNIRFPDVPAALQARDFAVRFPIVFRQQKTR